MSEYNVWWKVITTGQILFMNVNATGMEHAKEVVRNQFGYKTWDIKFTKVQIKGV